MTSKDDYQERHMHEILWITVFSHQQDYFFLFRETSFQQVLLSSSGPKENIYPSNFIYI